MNRTRLLLIGFVALALGAFVSFTVYRNLSSNAGKNNQPGSDVVVAATDLQIGTKVQDKEIKIVHYPMGDLPPNTFHQKSSVVGRGVVLPIAKGEFVLPTKLAGENAGSGLTSLIPAGMRAVPVRVNEVSGVAGFVLPGTRVDVLLTGNPSGAAQEQTTTVLENVAVIATGQKLERTSTGEPQNAPVITLLVSPDDAQKLTLAMTQGKIQLALRNPLDTRQQELSPVKTDSLYRYASTPAPAAPRSKTKRVAAPAAAPPPSVYGVEMIHGNKRTVTKCSENASSTVDCQTGSAP
jgi:pilus assembly protein CpaB